MVSFTPRPLYPGKGCRQEDNIKMGSNEIGSVGIDWIHVSQDRDEWWAVVNTIMNLRVP
jgi:hypothetical protein